MAIPNKLGLIAGAGDLPLQVVEYCNNKGIDLYVVVLKDFANPSRYQDQKHIPLSLFQLDKCLKYFKSNGVRDLIFGGGVKRPSFNIFKCLTPTSLRLLSQILKNKFLGDNTVLSTIIRFFNQEGFSVLEIDQVLDHIKFSAGFNTQFRFKDEAFLQDIELGVQTLKALSNLDIGQAVALQQGCVLGIECMEGTKELINRCSNYKHPVGRGPILLKMKKTNQTRQADLPSIGPDTIMQLHDAGFCGLVVDSQNCLAISIKKTLDLADKYNIFIYGI